MVTVVFGARGNVGRHVAAGLAAAGVPVRPASRTPDASHVAADLDVPETLPAALAGASQVFLYAKPAGIGGFATNARWWWTRAIKDGEAVRLPYPEALTAPVSERDMAALAVTALTERGHGRQPYTVYGPQALTLREQVGHIGAAIGRKIAIELVTPEEARADLVRTMPAMGVEAVMRGWAAGAEAVPETSAIVEKLTGRPAQTFAEWAQDHADDFRA